MQCWLEAGRHRKATLVNLVSSYIQVLRGRLGDRGAADSTLWIFTIFTRPMIIMSSVSSFVENS